MQDCHWDRHLVHIASANRSKQGKSSRLCPLPFQPGAIMAEKYVRMATMKSLTGAPQGAGIPDLISIVARCASGREMRRSHPCLLQPVHACAHQNRKLLACSASVVLPAEPLSGHLTCRSAELAIIKLRRSEKKASGIVGTSQALQVAHGPAGGATECCPVYSHPPLLHSC